MDERIKITTRKMRDGSYRSEVLVNGDFYASSRSNDREETIRTAQHYAMQIEFDEEGNW